MKPRDTDDPLDALLSEQNAYIEDNGFTARVISALPRRRRHRWWRPVILLGATTIGYILALEWMPWDLLHPSVLPSFTWQALLGYALLITVGGSLIGGVVAALESEE